MNLDPLFLSCLQWAWIIGWHILLPAFTVGLASFIAVLERLHFFTGREIWFRIFGFWTRIFAVSFGMGVVTGIVMPFQFGTNWSRFSDAAGIVISPLMAYEGLMALFLEATFLGVLLFGRTLVTRWMHFVAAVMVATGTLMSSFWILSANSWMQTPQGFAMVDGRFIPQDWCPLRLSSAIRPSRRSPPRDAMMEVWRRPLPSCVPASMSGTGQAGRRRPGGVVRCRRRRTRARAFRPAWLYVPLS